MNYPQPGAVGAGNQTDVVGRRIAAFFIDGAILSAITTAIVAIGSQSGELNSTSAARDYCEAINNNNINNGDACVYVDQYVYVVSASSVGLAFLVGLGFWLLNHVLLPTISGFSLGKGMVGLRVVRADNREKAGLGPNLIRTIVWVVDAAPYCFPLVGMVTMLTSDQRQRVGDRAGGTLVVARSSMGAQFAPPAPIGSTPPAPASQPWTPQSSSPSDFGPPTGAPADLAPPSMTAAPTQPPAAQPASTSETVHPGVDAPTWDPVRNTYIQWDKDLEAWMEWDANGQAWIPIST